MRHETICKEIEGQRFPKFSENFNLQIQRDQQIWSRIKARQIKYNQATVKMLKPKIKRQSGKKVRAKHFRRYGESGHTTNVS